MNSLIITPDHPLFYPTLYGAFPPGWTGQVDSDFTGCFAVRASNLELVALTPEEETEYLLGGEYDTVLDQQNANSNC